MTASAAVNVGNMTMTRKQKEKRTVPLMNVPGLHFFLCSASAFTSELRAALRSELREALRAAVFRADSVRTNRMRSLAQQVQIDSIILLHVSVRLK
jgi:hypothetical protein